VAALAGRHAKDDVRRTVMRLAVLGQLTMRGSRYSLPVAEAEQGWAADHEGWRRRELTVEDGIAAVRTILPRCWFNRVRCR
jgi:hypothetical protein